ncbi:MAG: hypothetical protein HYY55_01865 [Candidatus Niyogibacteria bacterium]|nr:MAG: hypothetical protein HYY55_01865 [Candidatus Niyogibacteria bacterium]
MKWFVWAVILVVAVSIIAGFFVVGSPKTERMRRFDDRRVSDLQNVQSQIVNFWQSRERLPESLDNLTDDVSGWFAPRDPETDLPYEYAVSDSEALTFSLCADFSLEGSAESNGYYSITPFGYLSGAWDHPSGYYCFDRTIDPELYPPLEKALRPKL